MYSFKNLMIVERGETREDVVSVLRNKYKMWFDEITPFQYKSKEDKVVLFYEEDFGPKLQPRLLLPPRLPIGYALLLCEDFSVKVETVETYNLEQNLITLREFLVATIHLHNISRFYGTTEYYANKNNY